MRRSTTWDGTGGHPATRGVRTALVGLAALLVGLTSGCDGTATSGSTTTGTATTGSATPGGTTTGSATAGSSSSATSALQNRRGLRFDREDLVLNGIPQGATATEVFRSLGSPARQESTVEAATGKNLLTCEYDGLTLEFVGEGTAMDQLRLRLAETTSPQYQVTRSLRVGDSVETVVEAFYRDANATQFEGYEGFTVLYGDPDALMREDAAGDVSFGYYNDDLAYYQSMTPPYLGPYATIFDETATIQFVFTDQKVSQIRWFFGPGAE